MNNMASGFNLNTWFQQWLICSIALRSSSITPRSSCIIPRSTSIILRSSSITSSHFLSLPVIFYHSQVVFHHSQVANDRTAKQFGFCWTKPSQTPIVKTGPWKPNPFKTKSWDMVQTMYLLAVRNLSDQDKQISYCWNQVFKLNTLARLFILSTV